MKLEDQVCSLWNAKKLAELGVIRKSYFGVHDLGRVKKASSIAIEEDFGWFDAYTVGELGEMLPHTCYSNKDDLGVCDCYFRGYFRVPLSVSANTEADARALMLIWLIENKHVDVNELNNP